MTVAAPPERTSLARIWHQARPYHARTAALVGLEVVAVVLMAIQPVFLIVLVDAGVQQHDGGAVARALAGLAATAVGWSVTRLISTRASARLTAEVLFDLRTTVFSHLSGRPFAFFAASRPGAMVSLVVNDTMGAASAVPGLAIAVVRNVGLLVATVAVIGVVEWKALVGLALIAVLLVPLRLVRARIKLTADQLLHRRRTLSAVATELLSLDGAELVKVTGAGNLACRSFEEAAADLRDTEARIGYLGALFGVATATIFSVGIIGLIGAGAAMATSGAVTTGTIVALIALLYRLQEPVSGLGALMAGVSQCTTAYRRIFEVLDFRGADIEPVPAADVAAPSVHMRPTRATPSSTPPAVELREVSFRYPEPATSTLPSISLAADDGDHAPATGLRPGVAHIDLRIERGGCTALIGPSGAGKSTIGLLIARLYRPDEGVILLDGRELTTVPEHELRSGVAVVSQSPHLLRGSVTDNLRIGREATAAELEDACRTAQIHERIVALPQGYATDLGERGARLSGGERQRLAIARALLGNPDVLVFDEATAQLDGEAEENVLSAMHAAMAGRSCLIITHRPAPLRWADEIVELAHGCIVATRSTSLELTSAATVEGAGPVGSVRQRSRPAGVLRSTRLGPPPGPVTA